MALPSAANLLFLSIGLSVGIVIGYSFHYKFDLVNKFMDGSQHADSASCSVPLTTSSTADSLSSSSSYFDEIQKVLYEKATANVQVERQPFILEEWSRGTGGLADADRKTLGELYLNANSVFEFGLGESTLIAAKTGVPRYAGVDSDGNWVEKSRKQARHTHFRFYFADTGNIRAYGHPEDITLQKIQYDYQMAALVAEDKGFDIYFVDGRYRVACTCASFLHAIKHGGNMDKVMVGVHDNDYPGRGYGVIKNIANVVIETEKLWVYKLKNSTTEEDIFQLWQNYTHNRW